MAAVRVPGADVRFGGGIVRAAPGAETRGRRERERERPTGTASQRRRRPKRLGSKIFFSWSLILLEMGFGPYNVGPKMLTLLGSNLLSSYTSRRPKTKTKSSEKGKPKGVVVLFPFFPSSIFLHPPLPRTKTEYFFPGIRITGASLHFAVKKFKPLVFVGLLFCKVHVFCQLQVDLPWP